MATYPLNDVKSNDDWNTADRDPRTEVSAKYLGNATDINDMSTLGRVQELRRNFRFISILGFSCILISTWEVILTLLSFALTDGGTAGLIWGFVAVAIGFSFVYMSVAELASMAPTSGGQYHWVSEFAPPRSQRFLSYITGWLCATGWQTAIVAISFLAGTIIQGLIILNDETYVPEPYHGTLLVIAIATFAILFNTLLSKKLPLVEALILIIHVLGLFAVIIPLWVLAPRTDAKTVFTEFTNAGGWSTTGTAVMVGLPTTMASLIGFDCSVHMSEEIKNASATLPKALMSSYALNVILGFVMVITVSFTLGDVEDILATPTGYPFIQLFYNTTGSLVATDLLVLILILALTASAISEIATASRQLWSFARDGGLPFSGMLSYVVPERNIPLNAVLVSLGVTIALSLINIGSAVALNAIVSLGLTALLSSYIICISCILYRRIRGPALPPRRWSLGRWGYVANVGALIFLLPIYVFMFFPLVTPVDETTMNWSVVIYTGIIAYATIYYVIYGRKNYVPPVVLVKRAPVEIGA